MTTALIVRRHSCPFDLPRALALAQLGDAFRNHFGYDAPPGVVGFVYLVKLAEAALKR